jgi:hypothetical protein
MATIGPTTLAGIGTVFLRRLVFELSDRQQRARSAKPWGSTGIEVRDQ